MTRDFNKRTTSQRFHYFRCPRCELVFLDPVPEDIGFFYPADYYTIPSSNAMLNRIAQKHRYQIDMVKRYVQGGRLLEIGPGWGAFAYLACRAGFDVEAIEMDDRCCRYLVDAVGVRTIMSNDPADALDRTSFKDVIALWHVLEHLPNPWICLRKAAEKLSPGGILLISTPNPSALQFRIMGARWPHLDAPRHLQLIPAKLLVQQVGHFGLRTTMLTSSDRGGRLWNAFGWQRLLMNLVPGLAGQLTMRGAGLLVSWAMQPIEVRALHGSVYTVIFSKSVN